MKIPMSIMFPLVIMSVVLPYLWFIFISRKSSRANKKQVESIIKKEHLTLNVKEQWNDSFIGIDEKKNILLFYKSLENKHIEHTIDLNDVTACKVNKAVINSKKGNKTITTLQTLDLELDHKSKKLRTILHFYNVNDFFGEDFEIKRAEKWLQLILQHCNKPPLNEAA